MEICLISSYTAQLIKTALEQKLREQQVEARITISEYNVIHDLLAEQSALFQAPPQWVILLYLPEDVGGFEEFLAYLQQFRAKFQGSILLSNLIAPTIRSLSDANRKPGAMDRFFAQQTQLKDCILGEGFLNTYLLDINSLAADAGHRHFFDPRLWFAYKIPFSQAGQEAIAALITRCLLALTTPRKKVITLDCDNTLWGGIIGEDGLQGIKLGPDYPGNCYIEFQRQLKGLKDLGYILTINSKNNLADVLEVLDQHPSQVLRRDDFVNLKVNWRNKVDNFLEMSQELNLGLDAFVFFDDNPAEVQLLNQALPQVATIQVPKSNPVEITQLISNHPHLFDVVRVTAEDVRKTRIYQEKIDRDQARLAFSNIQDYYRSLEMRLDIGKNSIKDIPRLAQMTLKTNQFNVVTIRRSEEEITRMITSGAYDIYHFRLLDRFGDNGIVGYCEVEKDPVRPRIRNFLMSCRVISRDAEQEFLTQILRDLQDQKAAAVTAEWLASPKNIICETFFETYGFQMVSQTDGHKLHSLELTGRTLESKDYFQVQRLPE
jgi:FkbH-like protein